MTVEQEQPVRPRGACYVCRHVPILWAERAAGSPSATCGWHVADEDPGVKRCREVLRVEREDGGRVEGTARLQHGGREVGLVGRVREVLGLERVGLALP